MRQYELMVVAKHDIPREDEKKRRKIVESLLSGQEHEELTVEDFGKRNLAYPIKKQTEACYLLARFKAKRIEIAKIEQRAKMSDTVLRYLLVVVEKEKK